MPMILPGPQHNVLNITSVDNQVSWDCVVNKDYLLTGARSGPDTGSVLFNDAIPTVESLLFRLQIK
jgi:hypothetical protein